jgi:hypothetical protein
MARRRRPGKRKRAPKRKRKAQARKGKKKPVKKQQKGKPGKGRRKKKKEPVPNFKQRADKQIDRRIKKLNKLRAERRRIDKKDVRKLSDSLEKSRTEIQIILSIIARAKKTGDNLEFTTSNRRALITLTQKAIRWQGRLKVINEEIRKLMGKVFSIQRKELKPTGKKVRESESRRIRITPQEFKRRLKEETRKKKKR